MKINSETPSSPITTPPRTTASQLVRSIKRLMQEVTEKALTPSPRLNPCRITQEVGE